MIPLIITVIIIAYLIYDKNKLVKTLDDKGNDEIDHEFSIEEYDFDSKTMTFSESVTMPDSSYSNGSWIYTLHKSNGNYQINLQELSVKLDTLYFKVPKNSKSNQYIDLIENNSISPKYIRYLDLVEKYGSALDTINLASNEPERQELSNLHFEHFQKTGMYDLKYLNFLLNLKLKPLDPVGLNHIRIRILSMHPNVIRSTVLIDHILATLDEMKQIKEVVTIKANQLGLILIPDYLDNKMIGYKITSDFIEANEKNVGHFINKSDNNSSNENSTIKSQFQDEVLKCRNLEKTLPARSLQIIRFYEKQTKSIKETLKNMESKNYFKNRRAA